LPIGKLIGGRIDKRIHNILREWDQRVAADPTMVENLQFKGSPDINAVRKLVESFIDPDTATSSRPEDGIRRHGVDEKVP
jgi:hypothetical protein